MTRQARNSRQRCSRFVLTDRDRRLLRALNRFRIARSSDLAALCFRGVRRDTAAARLRRLFDAGLLDVRAGAPDEENQYTVGAAGKRILENQGIPFRPVPRGGLPHHLTIVSNWVAIATGCPELRIEAGRPDWELRADAIASTWPVIPDLLLAVRTRSGRHLVIVEVDLGTEPLAELRSKVTRYQELSAILGTDELTLLVVVTSAERGRRIGSILEAQSSGPSAVCGPGDHPGAVLLRLLTVPLAPLAGSPCGKGRLDPVCAGPAPATPPSDGRL